MTESFQLYSIVFATLLIIVGYVAAVVFSRTFAWALGWLSRTVQHSFPTTVLLSARSETLTRRLVFVVTLGVFVMLAIRSLGFAEVASLLDPLLLFLPGIFSGAVILLIGYIASEIIFQLLRNAPWTNGNPITARTGQGVILTISILTALAQASVDVRLIEQTLIVVLFVSLGGLSLAFALGSKAYVANLLAKRMFSGFSVGDHIRMDGIEGTITEFNRSSVWIKTDEGVAVVPASVFASHVIIRLDS